MILLLAAVLLFGRSGCLKWALVILILGWACNRHPAAARGTWEYLRSLEQRLDELIDQYEQSHLRIPPEKTPAKQI
jgi:hypothetical protein